MRIIQQRGGKQRNWKRTKLVTKKQIVVKISCQAVMKKRLAFKQQVSGIKMVFTVARNELGEN